MKRTFFLIVFALTIQISSSGQTSNRNQSTDKNSKDTVSTREMDRINWMEFRDVVPSKMNTVLLPVGTLEPHVYKSL